MSKLLLKLTLPVSVVVGKKKYIINLNNMRNWHYVVKNKVKQAYQREIANQIPPLDYKGIIKLVFTMHRKDKRRVDRANVLCLHEKYACDALVENGFIKDDNDTHVESTLYTSGEIDKENPRVDMFIYEGK